MANEITFEVEFVEKELFNINFSEKEIVDIALTTIDVIPRKTYIWELEDISIINKENFQLLLYDESLDVWVNKHLSDLFVINEVPAQVTSKKYRLANSYHAGTLLVFLNGIKEKNITENSTTEFSFPIDIIVGDDIEVSYIRK